MKTIPFYILLLITLAMAGFDKIFKSEAPNWFLDQFAGTLLDLFNGALSLQFYLLGILESAAAVLILVGLLKKEFLLNSNQHYFLKYGIVLSQLVFIALGFGQRLTNKFDSAGQLFFYAALTFIAYELIALNDKKDLV